VVQGFSVVENFLVVVVEPGVVAPCFLVEVDPWHGLLLGWHTLAHFHSHFLSSPWSS
jgi:hypothetical protein